MIINCSLKDYFHNLYFVIPRHRVGISYSESDHTILQVDSKNLLISKMKMFLLHPNNRIWYMFLLSEIMSELVKLLQISTSWRVPRKQLSSLAEEYALSSHHSEGLLCSKYACTRNPRREKCGTDQMPLHVGQLWVHQKRPHS